MARPRTPSNVLELRGSFKKNPQRKRKQEPVPTAGIGPAPEHLPPRQRKIWDEMVALCPPGVLGNSDRIALEILVGLVEQYRHARLTMLAQEKNLLMSILGRFGLTPSDRSKIIVPKGKDKNPFGDLG